VTNGSFSRQGGVGAEVRERRNLAAQLRPMRADVGDLDVFERAHSSCDQFAAPVTLQGLQARILFQQRIRVKTAL
jgi:hypothetical protein